MIGALLIGERDDALLRAVCFGCRVFGICAVFYVLFLCRMLGAGDIKLMALCVGFLGFGDGLFVLFLGLGLAAARAGWLLMEKGVLWARMERLAHFIWCVGRCGKLKPYPGRQEETGLLRLGSYLFLGYCLFLVVSVLGIL